MAAFLLRKASVRLATRVYSYSLHPVIGPPGFSSSFSSSSGNSSSAPETSIVEKIENEIACYSNDLPMPRDFPFYLSAFPASRYVYMSRRFEKEIVTAVIDRDDPSTSIDAVVNTMNVEVLSTMTAKLDQLDICEVTVRDKYGGMTDYVEYLKARGITHETILHFYGLMGFKMQEVPEEKKKGRKRKG